MYLLKYWFRIIFNQKKKLQTAALSNLKVWKSMEKKILFKLFALFSVLKYKIINF